MVLRCHFEIAIVGNLLFLCFVVPASSIIVDSPFGRIKGKIVSKESSDHTHVVFRNIPYAKPPVGELRFAKPQPHPKLDGVFDGTDEKVKACITPVALGYHNAQESEDCLILSIYTKSISPGDSLRKVVVFIHGGMFSIANSDFHRMGLFVATHDVIGVSINYRLGVLGFLSTGNKASPGNYGLWDQCMALQWVKDNIKAFGGDPDDVTLSGFSAGGASVAYHSLSPVTKGLFSKAYLISGAATSVYARAIDVQTHALSFGKHTKCWKGEITEILDFKQSKCLIECLRNIDLSDIPSFMPYSNVEPQFVPSVDGDFIPAEASLLLQDESYLESIGFYNKSFLVSIVNNEFEIMKYLVNSERARVLYNSEIEENITNRVMKHNEDITNYYTKARLNTDSVPSSVTEGVMDFYNRRYIGDDALLTMITDLTFLIPSYDFLKAASKQGQCKTWFLYFNYFPAFVKEQNYRGTPHGDDLLYWQDREYMGKGTQLNYNDFQLRYLFSSVVADFIKNGEPGKTLNELASTEWPVFEPNNSYYLNFHLKPYVGNYLERDKVDFWLTTVPSWMNDSRPEN